MPKKTTTAVALFLVFTIASPLIASLPTARAANYKNFAYITVAPDHCGKGQTVTVVFFLTIPSPTASAGFNPYTNWNNFTVKITSPTGKVENFGPYTSDATGGAFFTYTPNEVGIYKLDFTFPGQTVMLRGTTYDFGPASASTTLTVQEEPIAGYSTPPLPTNYWARPIYGENRGWYQIGGNWLRATYNNTGPFNPYTKAPNTAHIVWAKNQYMGGVVGGEYGDLTYYQAPTYQSYWVPPLIINGRLYYMERQVPGNGWVGLHCVDIRSGNELWFRDVSIIGGAGSGGGGVAMNIYGQLFDAEGVNGHGVEPFIWNLGSNWTVFDANSGNPVYTITNPLAATSINIVTPGVSGPQLLIGQADAMGSIIAFYIDGRNNWLLKWNSTLLLQNYGINPISNLYLPPKGATIDWKLGIEWNVSIADGPGYPGFYLGVAASNGDAVFANTGDIQTPCDNVTTYAYSVKDGHELWRIDWTGIFNPGSTMYQFMGPVKDGVMTVYNKNTGEWYGYSAVTGMKMWGPTAGYKNAWDTFTTSVAAYGNLYVGTYAGKIYCYDLQTGKLEWNYTLPYGGFETPYGSYSLSGGITVADEKLYAVTGEHTPNSPYWLGGAMYCVNASTGDLVYKISGWWSSSPAIADGYALDHNCYDGTIYCFGKGQTTTTVSASPEVAVEGNSVLIKGSVMDDSPGVIDYAGNKVSTKKTPAIADEYMTPWMEYLYQQKPMPTNATGVTVTLSVVDANNNYREIGTTTSGADGFYSFVWKPDIPGKYTLYASFAGSESYWPSSAVTAFTVDAEPEVTPAPTPTPPSMADLYFMPMSVGMTVAIIAVIALLALLLLRKRP